MLNSEAKRKIDSARNILVGNVTNPISQVDQITNALIYKFMDDMDQENIDVDLKPQFFVGDYAKYAWSKLLDKKLSGQERMNLYMQATESMSKNPYIPQLFRDIFKGAFLPYNDPRVLTLFLKEINGFSYSHSEELGNAFEYLLSILGSQGDAGQFRTPRHIIDFIAEVVDPKKNETILDPACGTAGFLISAYKHILKNHDGLDNKTGKPTNKEKNLTPDEKTKLMNNIVGYDVSPDMVKLSLVNMYLHGFQSPKIHKYNTLTDEKRWDEQFDVIMANPPFMTPKGGVETHKRFSIQANRAEVLFVDYIMEHLSINGHAGIIVPEGIIFKGDKAYKALRKKLVEDGLFAVVSLPAGVFQPYSGVKTSILFFDNQVAKKTDEMLFVKVENDGFDLGAQRRKIEKNDLPEALKILEAWKKGEKKEDEMALWVKKEKIAESGLPASRPTTYVIKCNNDSFYIGQTKNLQKRWKDHKKGLVSWTKKYKPIEVIHCEEFTTQEEAIQREKDLKTGFGRKWLKREYKAGRLKKWNETTTRQTGDYNLAGERYREVEVYKNVKWEMVELGEVCEIYNGSTPLRSNEDYWENGDISWFTIDDIRTQGRIIKETKQKITQKALEKTSVKLLPPKAVLLCCTASVGEYAITEIETTTNQQFNGLVIKDEHKKKLDPYFLFQLARNFKDELIRLSGKTSFDFISVGKLKKIKIPLPPLSVQKEIVEQIEVKQNAINHAREIIKSLERERQYFGEELRKLDLSACGHAQAGDIEMVELGKIAKVISGQSPESKFYNQTQEGLPFYQGKTEFTEMFIGEPKKWTSKTTKIAEKNDILMSVRAPVGPVNIATQKICIGRGIASIRSEKIEQMFLFHYLKANEEKINGSGGAVFDSINRNQIEKLKIPLPSLAIQKQLVAEAQKEEEIIIANKRLIEIMEKKIEKVIVGI